MHNKPALQVAQLVRAQAQRQVLRQRPVALRSQQWQLQRLQLQWSQPSLQQLRTQQQQQQQQQQTKFEISFVMKGATTAPFFMSQSA
jgi:hypothetical protein